MRSSFWTPQRVERLMLQWVTGTSSGIIAGNLGTSREAVIGKLNRLGLIGSMSDDDRRRRISAGTKAGLARKPRRPRPPHSDKTKARMSRTQRRRWRRHAEELARAA